ncbi:MAG: helix-turn-helix transcriptional regulator [Ignavibacteriae bacterium]|nr:helix-turn-helix transcriptional regulator [Ignavibacteriota bacterium]
MFQKTINEMINSQILITIFFLILFVFILRKKLASLFTLYFKDHKPILKSKIRRQNSIEKHNGNEELLYLTDDKSKALLKKLIKFEESQQYTNKDVNFSFLANYIGTNSKYLNELLKIHVNKTYSQYINDLRIEYITNLLNHEPKYRDYTISYLAETCGYSSREVFYRNFKKKMRMTPSQFIKNLKNDIN